MTQQPKDMPIVVVTTKKQLQDLIKETMALYGPECDLNFIDVSQVTDMSGLFSGSHFNGDISRWNVSNVTNMSGMFRCASFNGDISRWNVSKVKDMSYMFCGYGQETTKFPFDGDISRWDVSSVTNMSGMFCFSEFNGNISKWNVSNVQFMKAMFACSSFSGDISEWDTSKVTNMDYIFRNSPMTESGKTPVWYKHVSNLDRDYKMSVKDITIILKNPADNEPIGLF